MESSADNVVFVEQASDTPTGSEVQTPCANILGLVDESTKSQKQHVRNTQNLSRFFAVSCRCSPSPAPAAFSQDD